MIHDGGDLSGLDSRYNLGTHSCTYYCDYCQIDDKNKLSEDGTAYRTRYNVNTNADLFDQANRNSNSRQRPLQISKGVSGRQVDLYPGASRITPPSLHIDMGIMTKTLEIHKQYVHTLSSTHIDMDKSEGIVDGYCILIFSMDTAANVLLLIAIV